MPNNKTQKQQVPFWMDQKQHTDLKIMIMGMRSEFNEKVSLQMIQKGLITNFMEKYEKASTKVRKKMINDFKTGGK